MHSHLFSLSGLATSYRILHFVSQHHQYLLHAQDGCFNELINNVHCAKQLSFSTVCRRRPKDFILESLHCIRPQVLNVINCPQVHKKEQWRHFIFIFIHHNYGSTKKQANL